MVIYRAEIKEMTEFLNLNYNNTMSLVIIPKRFICADASYVVGLYVQNFLGTESMASVSLRVSNNPLIPVVSIDGPYIRYLYNFQSLSLTASVSLPDCVNFVNKSLTYKWKFYESSIYRHDITSISPNDRVFKLSPFSLTPKKVYKLIFKLNKQ